MSNTPKPLRFGRWRVDTQEAEGGKHFVKMSSMVYRKSGGVSNVWKWAAWKEKMTIWTFHVLKCETARSSSSEYYKYKTKPFSFLKH